jgi:hypothetical protein
MRWVKKIDPVFMVDFICISDKIDMTPWPRESLAVWMHNASAQLHWHENTQIPFTSSFKDRHDETTYLMSLRSGWFDYAAHELHQRWLTAWGIRQLGKVVQMLGFDRLSLINNLPVSTQVHRSQDFAAIVQTCESLIQHQPRHFLGVRNLLPHQHASLITSLKSLGFVCLPSRVIYEFDLRQGMSEKPSHLMRDKGLLRKSELQVLITRDVTEVQASRLRMLYQQIYIQKHSTLNPQYTAQFFADMINGNVMQCLQLRDQHERILAFALLYKIGEVLTVPALGYDSQHTNKSLYRLLFATLHDYTQAHHLLLNYSSGAGDFKRKRGATAHLEYALVRAPTTQRFGQKRWLQWAQSLTCDINASDLIALGA